MVADNTVAAAAAAAAAAVVVVVVEGQFFQTRRASPAVWVDVLHAHAILAISLIFK